VDNTSLTGEREPVALNAKPSTFQIMTEAENMVFTPQPITAGSGKGIVVATGDITVNAIVAAVLSPSREYDMWASDSPKAKLLSNVSNILVALTILLYAARRLHGEKLINWFASPSPDL
jgi:magnesium-transporting ATPase (P-type)